MSQPLLSIGMIVKNEERCLEKCLKALEPLRQTIPCELVIADTGSTDRTKEIASKYADILFDFTWINDFSAARNAVMDKCSGKWYLTVDADEYLISDVEEIIDFLTSSLFDKKNMASIVIRNHNSPNMTGDFFDFNALRMIRLSTGKRYKGTIHEHFGFNHIDECQILYNTVFNHDGYSKITTEHLIQKGKRNLALLETQFAKEPDNLKLILQCIESSTFFIYKKIFYSEHAINTLQKKTSFSPTEKTLAPICAFKALACAIEENLPCITEWYNWILETFKTSYYIIIDANYIYSKYLYESENFVATIKLGKHYQESLHTYNKMNNNKNDASFINPVLYTRKTHELTIKILIANALLRTKNESEALKILTDVSLAEANEYTLQNWISAVTLFKSEDITDIVSRTISDLANNSCTDALYNSLVSQISVFCFTCKQKTEIRHSIFSTTPGTIGISAKIVGAKTTVDVEKYLNQIKNWEEFMPLSLKQVFLLKAELPEAFFSMSSAHIKFLINDISNAAEDLIDVLVEYYCDSKKLNNFPYISFFHNLFLEILFNTALSINRKSKLKLLDKFPLVADRYLNMCYNQELLKNDKYVSCITNLHLFSWYLVKATKMKVQNPLEYIRTLKTALKKVPQAKHIVEFLIEEFKNEEELKRQEKIKTASPELLAMAEQLKPMLATLPRNSPELLAIKQSPMYKQLAFLIEN